MMFMRFLKLSTSLNLKEIGDYPQIQTFKKGYDSSRPESCSRISRYDSEVPALTFDFDGMQLTKTAILTDCLNASYMSTLTGLLINDSFRSFISSKRIVENMIYPVGLYRGDEKLPNKYSWLHYTKIYPEMINYKLSHFFLNHSEANFKQIPISSYEEYLREQGITEFIIDSTYLVLRRNIASSFDILRIGVIKYETYVTEEVKDEMVANGFTGLVYEPADFLVID